ncbi:DUF6082 family protein [Streptomyces sp. NBC_00038]|uniref:DUF6082 family protein n=1 Tax=Streptomyces sp. NBC_00038 TaxID=2903615 RepID=UPI002251B938|nr:DUF6082 family protein [Streptomyces sp. NBC_00038]MCX5560416.1 DUF6082 family protein [Streptomyces sp. NBC_00038]
MSGDSSGAWRDGHTNLRRFRWSSPPVRIALVFQARESKASREQGRLDANTSKEARRRHLCLNLVPSRWEMMYELGALTDGRLWQAADSIFRAAPGCAFWAASRDTRSDAAGTRRARRFHQLVDESHARFATSPPGPPGG